MRSAVSLWAVSHKRHIFAPIYKDTVNIYGSTASIKQYTQLSPLQEDDSISGIMNIAATVRREH